MLYKQSIECLPALAQILTIGIEIPAVIGAIVLQFYTPTAHVPVDTTAAPHAQLDIAFVPAPFAEIVPAGHAAHANLAVPRGPGVNTTGLIALLSTAGARPHRSTLDWTGH